MKRLLVLILLLWASVAQATPILTTADTLHVELFNWNAAGTVQKAPESLFVMVTNPVGDSIYSLLADTTHASLKGPYLRRRGNGGTFNTYIWAQPVSVIDSDDGEGLYHISIVLGSSEDTTWYVDEYFQLVDLPLNTQLNEIAASLDSLQSQDGWVAQQAILANVRDTVNATLDSVQNFDAAGHFMADIQAVLDSLNSHDGWVAQQAEVANLNGGTLLAAADVWNIAFNTSWTAGSMGDSLNNASYVQGSASGLDSAVLSRVLGRKVWGIAAGSGSDSSTASQRGVDMRFISADQAAADNFETMLDGTGGQVLSLGQLRVIASSSQDTAAVFYGADAGPGLHSQGGATGVGMNIEGGTTSGDGAAFSSVSGEGIQANGGTNGTGIAAIGAGTGDGLRGTGGATGNGLAGIGGATSGRGLNATATASDHGAVFTGVSGNGILVQGGTNSDGFRVTGNGSGDGIDLVAGATGVGLRVAGGGTSGDGITVTATSGDGADISGGTNGMGVTLTGAGTGEGILAIGGSSAHGIEARGGTGAGLHGINTFAGSGSNGSGLKATGDGSGSGFLGLGGITGRGMKLDSGFQVIDNAVTYEIDTLTADPDPISRLVVMRGTVDGGASATTFTATELTGANDYYNKNQILFVTGNAAGQVSWFYDFVAAADSAVLGHALTTSLVAGDSFYVLGIFADTTGAAGSTDSGLVNRILARTIYADNTVTSRNDVKNILDSIQAWDAANGVTNDIQAILDSLRNFDAAGHFMADIQAVLDSLNSQDGWVAQQAILANVRDTTNAIIDTLQNHDNWVAQQSEVAGLDGGALLTAAGVWNLAFNTAFTAGSMGDSLNNASYVQGAASGLTAAEIWNYSFAAAHTAGSFGDSLNNASYVQGGAAGITAASVADTIDARAGTGNPVTVNVTGTVTVGTNNDKTGYSLTTVERQASADSAYAQFTEGANEDQFKANVTNLDVAVSTRLAPTVAGRTLDVATTGEAGVDLNNVLGTMSGSEILLTQAEFTPDYAVAGDAMTLTGPERAAIADSVNAQLAAFLVDSLNQVKEAARLVAVHQGIIPSVYDSAKIVMYPGAWTPNKDSLKAFTYRGAVIDTVVMNHYRWGYYVVGSDSTAVADTIGVYKR